MAYFETNCGSVVLQPNGSSQVVWIGTNQSRGSKIRLIAVCGTKHAELEVSDLTLKLGPIDLPEETDYDKVFETALSVKFTNKSDSEKTTVSFLIITYSNNP